MIRLHTVTKVYDNTVVALREVNLEVAKGEFVFLVGPSGSGKSTMLRLMMREDKPDTGEVWVAGKHASELPSWKVPHLRRSIGTVFQDFKLLPNKTVYENVSFALEVTGRSRHVVRNQVPQVLKLVGLSNKSDRQPRQLSGGEQQRVSIARAFVNRPLILLADEPTGNLDPATSVGIMRILDRINRTGTTVVMATHDHAIVDAMRRRVVQLDDGRVIRDQRSGGYEIRVQSNVRAADARETGEPLPGSPPDPVELSPLTPDQEPELPTSPGPEPEQFQAPPQQGSEQPVIPQQEPEPAAVPESADQVDEADAGHTETEKPVSRVPETGDGGDNLEDEG
jgi:cell division transport system ATP-binding protein